VQSSDSSTKHGPNAHCVIFDELHAQPNRDLWDTTTKGIIARRQPLVAALTTAGWDRNSVCWEQHEHARQVAEDIYVDDRYLGVVYGADDEADWTSEAVWRAAAPSLGITVSIDTYAAECVAAKQMPTSQNAFRQLFLSQWTQQAVRYIPLDAWDACTDEPVLKTRKICYGGLDLASTTDLAAFALVFPNDDGKWDILVKYYMPAENIRRKSLRDRVPYEQWIEEGLITTTPGKTIKYEFIQGDIIAARKEYQLHMIGYDPWNAESFQQWMERERIPHELMIQGFRSFTSPTKELVRLVLEGQIRHGGNKVLRWNVDSAAAEEDAAGNVKLNKAKSSARIDGLIAVIMAFHVALKNPTNRRRSVYEREDYGPGETSAEAKGE
jgi:phage terminase large subunit-like protein